MYFSQLPDNIRQAVQAVINAAEDRKALECSLERAEARLMEARHALANLIAAYGANNAA
jgi:regulator of protease activity HflC (stomatin/prohibitin superfamily)